MVKINEKKHITKAGVVKNNPPKTVHPIVQAARQELIGKRIVDVRQLTPAEVKGEYWDRGTTALVLDDGTLIYPSQDDEGNGPGALFGSKRGQGRRFGYQDSFL